MMIVLLAACDDEEEGKLSPDGGFSSGDGSVFDSPVAEAGPDTNASIDAGVDGSTSDALPLTPGAVTPFNYRQASDSPFAGVNFLWFHLEDFEDSMFNVPGVSKGGGRLSSTFGPSLIDSVDGDDGIPDDNRCIKPVGTCNAWWGAGSLRFDFDPAVLGALPTHAGAVWTDGAGKVGFEAFGPDGEIVYKIEPFSEPGFPDSTVNSSTAEDRFFGAYHPAGISGIRIFNTAGGVEVDHLQYGRAR